MSSTSAALFDNHFSAKKFPTFYNKQQTYTVAPNEDLTSIEQNTGIPINVIARFNNIENVNKILAGTTLQLPAVHIIMPQEKNLADIAKLYALKEAQLRLFNPQLTQASFAVGNRIYLPQNITARQENILSQLFLAGYTQDTWQLALVDIYEQFQKNNVFTFSEQLTPYLDSRVTTHQDLLPVGLKHLQEDPQENSSIKVFLKKQYPGFSPKLLQLEAYYPAPTGMNPQNDPEQPINRNFCWLAQVGDKKVYVYNKNLNTDKPEFAVSDKFPEHFRPLYMQFLSKDDGKNWLFYSSEKKQVSFANWRLQAGDVNNSTFLNYLTESGGELPFKIKSPRELLEYFQGHREAYATLKQLANFDAPIYEKIVPRTTTTIRVEQALYTTTGAFAPKQNSGVSLRPPTKSSTEKKVTKPQTTTTPQDFAMLLAQWPNISGLPRGSKIKHVAAMTSEGRIKSLKDNVIQDFRQDIVYVVEAITKSADPKNKNDVTLYYTVKLKNGTVNQFHFEILKQDDLHPIYYYVPTESGALQLVNLLNVDKKYLPEIPLQKNTKSNTTLSLETEKFIANELASVSYQLTPPELTFSSHLPQDIQKLLIQQDTNTLKLIDTAIERYRTTLYLAYQNIHSPESELHTLKKQLTQIFESDVQIDILGCERPYPLFTDTGIKTTSGTSFHNLIYAIKQADKTHYYVLLNGKARPLSNFDEKICSFGLTADKTGEYHFTTPVQFRGVCTETLGKIEANNLIRDNCLAMDEQARARLGAVAHEQQKLTAMTKSPAVTIFDAYKKKHSDLDYQIAQLTDEIVKLTQVVNEQPHDPRSAGWRAKIQLLAIALKRTNEQAKLLRTQYKEQNNTYDKTLAQLKTYLESVR